MTKQQILEMTGLSEQEFYNKYPDQQSFMMEYGGMVEQYKKGGWIQKATASIKRRGTEGKCTPMSKPGCTGRALALAKTFHKMAAKRKKKEEGGYVDMYEDGGETYTPQDRAQDSTYYADYAIPANMRKILLGDTFGSYEEIGSAEDYGYNPSVEEMREQLRNPQKMGYSMARQSAIDAFRNKGAAGKLYLTNDEVAKIAKRFKYADAAGKMSTSSPMYGTTDYDLKATLSAPDYWRVMQEIKRLNTKKADGGMVDAYQLMGMPTPSMYAMGGYAMMEDYGRGGMIKRKDGSYSRRGLWDSIRANRGSGKKPTAEMLRQERKIRAAEKKEYGGPVMYGMGGTTNIGDLSHVISAKNFPNMGYAMGGPVMYKKGGFLTGLGDFGLALADTATSVVNPDIIGADSYSDTGFGRTMQGVSDITGGITNAAAPIVAGALLGPVGSAAVSSAQNMSKQFVPAQQDNSTTRQIGNMFGSLAPLGGAIYAASANSTSKAAMGGQVNYPQGLRKNMGNMPIFARGGNTEMTEGELEHGENLNVMKNGMWQTATKYESGGMGRHDANGNPKPEQVVPLPVGASIAPRAFKKEDDLAEYDKLLKESLHGKNHNNIMFPGRIEIAKRKKEAKEQQLAAAQEQKATRAMTRMMGKYGGAIQRMMARGGMVPMYDLGGGTGGLNTNNPALSNYNFSNQFNTTPGHMFLSVPQSLNLDHSRPAMTENTSMFGSLDPTTFNFDNIPDTGIGYKGKGYKKLSPPNSSQNNWGQYLPMATSLAMGLEASLQKPYSMKSQDYETPADLKWRELTGEAGRRDLGRAYAGAKYAARNIGGSNALAALTQGANQYYGQLAKYNENLENINRQGQSEIDVRNKTLQQANMNQRMQIAMFNEQNRAARRNAMREQFGKNLPASFYNQQSNQITMEALKAAYPDYNFDFGIFG
jgi:hypothetical protein